MFASPPRAQKARSGTNAVFLTPASPGEGDQRQEIDAEGRQFDHFDHSELAEHDRGLGE
jgi:hypothetical protein